MKAGEELVNARQLPVSDTAIIGVRPIVDAKGGGMDSLVIHQDCVLGEGSDGLDYDDEQTEFEASIAALFNDNTGLVHGGGKTTGVPAGLGSKLSMPNHQDKAAGGLATMGNCIVVGANSQGGVLESVNGNGLRRGEAVGDGVGQGSCITASAEQGNGLDGHMNDATKKNTIENGFETKGDASPMIASVVAAAMIPEVRQTPKRASPRLALTNDLDSMRKAKKRAAWKNLDFDTGNIPNLSFIRFPSVDISSRLSDMGISLGSNNSLASDSISLLKSVELERARPEPSSTEVVTNSNFLEDDNDSDLENGTLGRICGDLLDEFKNLDSDHLSCYFKAVFKKNKASSMTRSKKKPKVRVIKKHRSVSP